MSLRIELFSSCVKGAAIENADGHFSHFSLISSGSPREEAHLHSDQGPNPSGSSGSEGKVVSMVPRGCQVLQQLPATQRASLKPIGPPIPPYLPTRPPALSPLTKAAPLARASHTPLCDVVSRHRMMWGPGSVVVGAGQALLGGVKTYLWCHLSCSDK